MILEELERGAASRLRAWALARGLPEPADIPFAPPPPHLKADLSLPWALSAGKALKRNPIECAREIAQALSGLPEAESVSAAPPGFVNFRLSPGALVRNLGFIASSPATYGARVELKPRSLLLEYVSANPTGPLHLASGRAAALGDSLVRILRRIGHKAAAEYYVNDAGARAGALGRSLKARWEQLRGLDAQIPEDGYHGEYLKEMAAQLPPEASGWTPEEFGCWAMERLIAMHHEDMDAFGAVFDRWVRESELHASQAVEAALAWLKERGMAYEKAGAVWLGTVGVEGSADDKDRVLVKSGGQPTYFLADIAYHKDKFDRGWTELIDIWGADHHGYVPRMKAAVAAMGRPPESLHAIIHQLVHLYRGKEAVKMSKRAGEFVTLRDLVGEVGRDACRFFFAMRTPNVHMNFDLELAKKRAQENPVYYVQYVHARVCSIFREARKAGLEAGTCATLPQPEERALLVKLAWFPGTLKSCEEALSPHPLASYLLELAGLFHPFYEKCRVVDSSDRPRSEARLALCAGVRAVIKEGLGLLGVGAPERM